MSRVGIIDPDGILKGSTRSERNSNTIRNIGKNDRAYSTMTGRFGPPSGRSVAFPTTPPRRPGARNTTSNRQMTPLVATRRTRITAEIDVHFCFPTVSTAMNASCGISTVPNCFMHLPRLLLLEQFALARHVAAITLGRDVPRTGFTVSRATTCDPITAWIATSNCCRGIQVLHLPCESRPRLWASAWCTIEDRGIDPIPVDQYIELDHTRGLEAPEGSSRVIHSRA